MNIDSEFEMVKENLSEHERISLSYDEAEKIRMEQMKFAERIAMEAKRQEYRSRQFKLLIISSALAIVIGATTLVASQIVGLNKFKPLEPIFSLGTGEEIFASKSDLDKLRAANDTIKDALKQAVERARESQGEDSSANLGLSVISTRLEEIEKRLATLEKSISDNPEKALSIPILRKDQDNLSKTFDTNRISVAAEIARVNDLQKWILGGIGTVLVTVIAGLFTSLFTVLSKWRSER